MARPNRTDLPDGIFHVTARGVDGHAIFIDADDRHLFCRLLGLVVGRCAWRLDAYCLLDNHFHLVLDATRANLSSGMQLLNGRYAVSFNEKRGRRGHLFGHRFAARAVEGDRYHEAACRYVAWNPVAAGLCERPSEWLWVWSRFGFED